MTSKKVQDMVRNIECPPQNASTKLSQLKFDDKHIHEYSKTTCYILNRITVVNSQKANQPHNHISHKIQRHDDMACGKLS